MAFTYTHIFGQSVGALKCDTFRVTADAATQTVTSGQTKMKRIEFVNFSPVSMTTASAKLYVNTDASGAASGGAIGVSGVANGDIFFLTIYGR